LRRHRISDIEICELANASEFGGLAGSLSRDRATKLTEFDFS
jgi:hypothetical protein